MASLTIDLPESVPEPEARLLLAIKLFEENRLSAGKAAELAGYSKRTFLELLGKRGIPAWNYAPDDLGSDLTHARRSDGQ